MPDTNSTSAYLTTRGRSIIIVDQAGKVLEAIPCGNEPAANRLLSILAVAAPAVWILNYTKPEYLQTARELARLLTKTAFDP